jgi:hypothetical protein
MVQLPSPQQLERLKSFKELFCLTIYAPHIEIDPRGLSNPNRIELKNMLAQAETALLDDGVEPRDVKQTLRPARGLLSSREFWPIRSENLVLFMHPKLFDYYHVPGDIPYALTVSRGFNLDPLLEIMRDNRSYLVLALSHKNVRMYEGDRFTIRRLKLKNFPTNMELALGIDEYPNWLETHRVAPTRQGKKSEDFHGQYNENETDKQMLLRFFRMIDVSLRKFLQKKDKPLILAGVDYLLPIYREANTSPYLMKKALTGNYERANPGKLREEAWQLLKAYGG